MKKYWHVLNVGIQNNLTYRFNFLARTVFGLVPLIAVLYVWKTIYQGKKAGEMVGDYTLAQMISYYLLATIVDALTAVNEDDWQIAADIKDGNISQFLLKPIDYLWFRLCLFISGRLTYLAVATLPLALFILYLHRYFVLPPDWPTLGFFLVSTLLTALLQFFMSYTMAMLAFWVLEVSTFIFILFAFEYIASGHLFPLDILPHGLAQALFFTPFPYQLYFPVSIYMGKIAGAELLRGLLIQALWVVAAYLLARFAWARGIKKYSAVGIKHESGVRSPKSKVGGGDACRVAGKGTDHGLRVTPLPSRITHHASRYAAIYAALWKNSVTREMIFKSNFLLWILVEVLWFGLQLSFIGVLYLHTDHIGSWSKWQVVMLIGGSHFIQQVFQAFFLVNCTNLSELIRTGKLDFLLVLPVNTRFVVSLRQVDLGGFVNASFALAVMAYAARQIPITPSLLQIAGFLALCVAGILIHYSLMFLLTTISFWTVRAQGIVWGYYNLFQVARMPDEAFQRGLFRNVFTFAIPMLLVSNVPVRVLANKLTSPGELVMLLAMSVVCFAVSEWGWRASLRRYTSASS